MAATPEELRLHEKIIRAKVRLEELKKDHSPNCMVKTDPDYIGPCSCGARANNAAIDAVLKELA